MRLSLWSKSNHTTPLLQLFFNSPFNIADLKLFVNGLTITLHQHNNFTPTQQLPLPLFGPNLFQLKLPNKINS